MDLAKAGYMKTMEIFGDFIEDLPPSTEYLVVGFSPSSRSIKQRWRNNGLSAGFLADYLATFFVSSDGEPEGSDRKAAITAAVNYVANELLENAMKFSDEKSEYQTTIQLHLYEDRIVLLSKNGIDGDRAEKLQRFIEKVSNCDPQELYISQLEKNATDESHSHSGLGYLTLINDYGVKMGWKLETVKQEPQAMALTTMIQLSFENLI